MIEGEMASSTRGEQVKVRLMPFVKCTLEHPVELYVVEDMARVIKKAASSFRSDDHRNPASLPPSTKLPGTRSLLWHPDDVSTWLRR